MLAPGPVPPLLAALLASGLLAHAAVVRPSGAAHAPHPTLRILCLGDSYTACPGVPAAEHWPALLAAQLAARGWACPPPTVVAGVGWATDELSAAMDAADLGGPYDLVTLLVGVNDQFRGRALERFQPQFNLLLSRALELAGRNPRRVVVLSIPDWGVTPYGRGREAEDGYIAHAIDRYNQAIRERAGVVDTRWVDVTALSRRHGDDARFLAADGLHPSGAAYREWAAAVADTLRDLVPRARR